VFEYGSGFSTIWWASRTSRIVSVEHNERWYEEIRSKLPGNATALFRALEYGGDYHRAILDADGPFDIVVIDGRDRVNCAKVCVPQLTDGGVVIWDNSERENYEEGRRYLRDSGFRRIDFVGLGPVNFRDWMTTVFYRSSNCLGI
jgi:predicted O-methyltransferase YrrM